LAGNEAGRVSAVDMGRRRDFKRHADCEMRVAMTPELTAGAAGALVVGFTGSVHCLLMCGPLACAAAPGPAPRRRTIAAYQGARFLSYALVGAVLGGAGGTMARTLAVSTRGWLPWVMAAALLGAAFEVGKFIRPPKGLSRFAGRVAAAGARISPVVRAGAIGAVTPLLPCGLLFGVFLAAASAGSILGGALVMGAFALGAVPALLGAQLQPALWRSGAGWGRFVFRRVVPIAAAVVLVARAALTSSGASCH
jgi:sulfite exporter TauE/SafE